jgi:hypothetical protein
MRSSRSDGISKKQQLKICQTDYKLPALAKQSNTLKSSSKQDILLWLLLLLFLLIFININIPNAWVTTVSRKANTCSLIQKRVHSFATHTDVLRK